MYYEPSLVKYTIKKWAREWIPAYAYYCYSQLLGTAQQKQEAAQVLVYLEKIESKLGGLKHFRDADWRFKSDGISGVLAEMEPEQRVEFACDCKDINWGPYLNSYLKGIAIWVLNENHIQPLLNYKSIV